MSTSAFNHGKSSNSLASETGISGLLSSFKAGSLRSTSKQMVARRLIVQDALNSCFANLQTDNMRVLSAIRSDSEDLVNQMSIQNSDLKESVEAIATRRRTSFRSQMVDLCTESGAEPLVVKRVESAIDIFDDAYVVYGLYGFPILSCKVNCIYPERLMEKCYEGDLIDALDTPNSGFWAGAYKDPCRYAPTRNTFFDHVVYLLEEKFSKEDAVFFARQILRPNLEKENGCSLNTVVISTSKPDYVPCVENLGDWQAVAGMVAGKLMEFDADRLKKLRTFPKNRTYNMDVGLVMPDGIKPIHQCPFRLRFKDQVWIHGSTNNEPSLPKSIEFTWDEIEQHCPDFVTQSFDSVEIMTFLSKHIMDETLAAVQAYREWKNSNKQYIPYKGEYYKTNGGIDLLKSQIVSSIVKKAFPDYETVHLVLNFLDGLDSNQLSNVGLDKLEEATHH